MRTRGKSAKRRVHPTVCTRRKTRHWRSGDANRLPPRDTPAMPLSRKLAILLIVFGLCLLARSHYKDGLVAQQGLLLGIMPPLFAGLLLGRTALWLAATAYFAILLIGSWVDLRHGTAGIMTASDVHAGLLQRAMGCLIVALIMDRLLLKSEIGRKRSRDLALLCRQLEMEIQEKERSQAQLIHSQRLDSLGKLAGNVAHDFNNLLCVILGYATQRDYADTEQERFRGIAAAARHGQQLTDKLLTLARPSPLARETFDANAALEELLPMIASMLGARIRVQTALCLQAAWIHMDRLGFEAGVLNFAKNAGDAITGNGTFSIESSMVEGEVRLCFSDDGCGMQQEVAARVFEPFFTTKSATRGTGIGLAVIYRLVVESAGRIDVQSTPGHGTRFSMHLPLRDAPSQALDASPA